MNSPLIDENLDVSQSVSDDEEEDQNSGFQVVQPCLHTRPSIQSILRHYSPASSSIDSTLDELFTCDAIMITDGDADSHNTVAVLRYCRNRILRPRDIVLSLLGYREWAKDGSGSCLGCSRLVNSLYFVFMLLFLSLGPILQYSMCFKRDHGISDGVFVVHNRSDPHGFSHNHKCTGNYLFVYIIPSVMFFIAYCMACLVLRFGDSENLQTLLERVYLIATCSPWEVVKHRNLGYVWIGWLSVGLICLTLSVCSMTFHLLAAKYIPCSVIVPCSENMKLLFSIVAVSSLWMGDVTLVVGVLLYCSQCHLLSILLHIIRETLLQGAASLLAVKKQIDESTRFVQHLNRELGLIVGLIMCMTLFRAVTGLADLIITIKSYDLHLVIGHFQTKADIPWWHIAGMTCNLLCWMLLSVTPLIMAARVSNGFKVLNKVGSTLHARPFGYQLTPQQDIDSFLLYVSSLYLKAKILWIPVRTYFLVSFFLLLIMTALVLGYLYF